MKRIDYSLPVTLDTSGLRGDPKNVKAEKLGNSDLYIVSWDESDEYASGRCLFDEYGKWVGDLENPHGIAGSGLTVINKPGEASLYVRVSPMGEPTSLEDKLPTGHAVACIKLTFKDGVVIDSELVRSNVLPMKELKIGSRNPYDRRDTDERRKVKVS